MNVSERMTRDVRLAAPDDSLQEVARCMADCDIGALPVGDGDRLVGMITDRDIVVRGIAAGKGANATVRDVMSPAVCYCFEDEDVEQVAHNMGDQQLRRLPVVSRDKRLVGIISLADIAVRWADAAGDALAGVARPGGTHSQGAGARA